MASEKESERITEPSVIHEQYQQRTVPVVTSSTMSSGSNTVQVIMPANQKNLGEAYLLAVTLGFFGAHHFYLARPNIGIVYLLTFGLCGIGYLVDLCRLPFLVKETNRKLENRQAPTRILLSDAYLLWIPPFGLFGFHHFHLRRYGWGVAYIFTLGFLGVGWIIDACRMKKLVDDLNSRLEGSNEATPGIHKEKGLCEAYILTLFPITGILGFQHYYLGRYGFGLMYTFTLGFLGIGWLMDCLRMACLVKDVNRKIQEGDQGKRRLDDCYILLFPLGFLGLHHFYLYRPCWGVVYFCTFGCLGIGWLIDFCRLPFLVRNYNRNMDTRRNLVDTVQRQYGTTTTVLVTEDMTQNRLYPDLPPPYPGPQLNYFPGTYVYPGQGQYQEGGFYNQAHDGPASPHTSVNQPPPYQENPPEPTKSAPPNFQHSGPPSAPPSDMM